MKDFDKPSVLKDTNVSYAAGTAPQPPSAPMAECGACGGCDTFCRLEQESPSTAPQPPSVGEGPLCIECWQCQREVSLIERADNDGECPGCAAELDASMYLEEFVSKYRSASVEITARDQQIARLRLNISEMNDEAKLRDQQIAELQARVRELEEGVRWESERNALLLETVTDLEDALAQQVTKDATDTNHRDMGANTDSALELKP